MAIQDQNITYLQSLREETLSVARSYVTKFNPKDSIKAYQLVFDIQREIDFLTADNPAPSPTPPASTTLGEKIC